MIKIEHGFFFLKLFSKKQRHIWVYIMGQLEKVGESEHEVSLKLHITKQSDDLEVCVVARANFMIDDDSSDVAKRLLNENTVAIMFPYVRSQVSLLTTQPGMTPILVPTINTTKLL